MSMYESNESFTKNFSENTAYSDISIETRNAVETFCFVGLTTLACLLGIPANVINCLVFSRQGLRDRMNLCVFSLALTDFFLLVCAFFIYSVGSFVTFYDIAVGEEYFLKAVVSLIGATQGFRLTSGCISVVIAVERCVCVMFPLHVSTIMRTSSMCCLLLMCFVISQCIHVVLIYLFTAVLLKQGNSFKWMLIPTEFYKENNEVINLLMYIVVGTALPVATFSVVCVATIITILKLKISMEWRESSSLTVGKIHNRQMALTWMLVAVSCVYIITMVPFVIWQIIYVVLQDLFSINHLYNVYMAINAIVNCCPLVNSTVHFFIYFLRSSRFRKVFFSTCCYKASLSFLKVGCVKKCFKNDTNT